MARSLTIEAEKKRLRQLNRCKNDLFYLVMNLGYGWNPKAQQGVTEGFHGPLCRWEDENKDHKRTLILAPRKGLKTTVFTIGWCIQQLMIDPDTTIAIFHWAEEEAQAMIKEIGHHLQNNIFLKRLEPIGQYPLWINEEKGIAHPSALEYYSILPAHNNKKFMSASKLTVANRPMLNPTTMRQPSVAAKGVGSTATGMHVDNIILEDIIGYETTQEVTGMARVREWVRATVTNVLNKNGRVRARGTRWDEHDVWSDFLKSKQWKCIVRAAMETDGLADENGEPTHYGPTPEGEDGIEAALEREKHELLEMGPRIYSAQRQNQATSLAERVWDARSCEHYIDTLKEAMMYPGRTFVLSDPAPAKVGSQDITKEKSRGDATKDDWAFAVVRLRVNKTLLELVILYLEASKTLEIDQGMDLACNLMHKFGTNMCFHEAYGGLIADYTLSMKNAAKRNGVRLFTEDGVLPQYTNSYATGAKNIRIKTFADWARDMRVYVCRETVPPLMLESEDGGTGMRGLWEQARPFRIVGKGNNLKYDDVIDVCARATDPKLREYSPQVESMADKMEEFWGETEESEMPRTANLGW